MRRRSQRNATRAANRLGWRRAELRGASCDSASDRNVEAKEEREEQSLLPLVHPAGCLSGVLPRSAVRTPQILLDDQSGAFKAIHTVLAIISIALAALAQRDVQRERETTATPARL